MSKLCAIHQVLDGERDPNDCAIEVLHASCIRMMTMFVIRPTPALAGTLARMMGALARHDGRFVGPQGIDVYAQAAEAWQRIAQVHACAGAHADVNEPASRLH